MAHLTLLLVLLWVGTTVSTVVDVDKRIIGGQQCGQNERRYHVKLISFNETHESLCGGSLINDRWILTVAHCWKKGFNMSVILGVHPGPEVEVKITTAPNIYIFREKMHDIMLLKLPAGTQIPTGVKPIEIGDCDVKLGKGSTVQIAGYAATTTGRNNILICGESPTLQCANINVADCGEISQYLKKTKTTRDHWFCGDTPGVSSCPGDSGGGVVYNNRLYGLIRGSGEHLNQLPVFFVNLCHPDYFKWIKKTAVL